MTTRCRCLPSGIYLPAAIPTLSATSEVIGGLFARPRIPSVPKYRRVMLSASLANLGAVPRAGHERTSSSARDRCRLARGREVLGRSRDYTNFPVACEPLIGLSTGPRRCGRLGLGQARAASARARALSPCQTAKACRVAATSCTRRICTPWAAPMRAAASDPGSAVRRRRAGQVADEAFARGSEHHRHSPRHERG